MLVTLEPCPHCGIMLTPSLVVEIKDPKGEASCPTRPRPGKSGAQLLGEAMLEVARSLPAYIVGGLDSLAGREPR